MSMADDIFEAEIFDSSADRNKTQLNISLYATAAFCVVFLFLSMSFGNALSGENDVEGVYDWWDVPLNQRYMMDLPMDTMRAQLPENGTYGVLPYTEHFISVDLPASEQDVGYPDDAKMHVALWLPDVEDGVKVPVIMTIHPYYDFGGEGMPGVGADSNPNTIPDGGVGQWVYDLSLIHI